MQISFVSSCLPRKCGIATFSSNLSKALEKNLGNNTASFIALNNNGRYDYPSQIIYTIEEDNLDDYRCAAAMINSSNVDVVSLQHEFGLFGGPDGIYITEFLKHLRKPVVTTYHTVLKNPSPGQKKAFVETAELSQALVVMNRLAITFMTDFYDIPHSKINLIPHGVPESKYMNPSHYKQKLKIYDSFLILTFGFLSPNKGIENMLEALPEVVKKHPQVLYMVLGITHPVENKHNGESYRQKLECLVKELGLARNVCFINEFVDDATLNCYVGAADLVVCPYHSEEQMTSGVLSTALSKGKAIISTPYLHAQETLAGGRGRLVNAKDQEAMSEAVLDMMENPWERQAYAKKAYALGSQMGWGSVSRQYMETFANVLQPTAKASPLQKKVHTLPMQV